MGELKSYKPYARLVTVVSGIIILISVLDANQLISLFPKYASQITTIIAFAGILAPAISQEMRVGRAEELIEEEYNIPTNIPEEETEELDGSDDKGI